MFCIEFPQTHFLDQAMQSYCRLVCDTIKDIYSVCNDKNILRRILISAYHNLCPVLFLLSILHVKVTIMIHFVYSIIVRTLICMIAITEGVHLKSE